MAISKVKLPDNSVQDIHDARGVDTNGSFYFVQGSSSAAGSSTSGAYLSVKWEGTVPGVSAAYNGLKIAYRIATRTGVASGGVVLSIDNGAHYYPVVIQKNTMLTTHYPVGATFLAVFNDTQTATAYLTSGTKSTVTGCWQIMEYDSNTNTYQREYVSSDNTEYPITARYNTTTGESYYAEYGRYSESVTLNPSTNKITAAGFKVTGGTSSQFLKADGSVDSAKYNSFIIPIVYSYDIQTDIETYSTTVTVAEIRAAMSNHQRIIASFSTIEGDWGGDIEMTYQYGVEYLTSIFTDDGGWCFPGMFYIDVAESTVSMGMKFPDSEPTLHSGNVITSGGVYTALQAKYEKPSGGIPASDLASGVIPTVPTISTSVQSDKTSDTKTSSPKSVYNEVHPAIVTTQPSGGFVPNVLYNLGTITGSKTFTLATPSDNTIVNHYYWTFTAGSTAPTITWPSGVSWFGGSAPVISASKHYDVSVLDNIGVCMEV